MTSSSTFRLIGFDASRPPTVQPRPCIDLIFELDTAAPPLWCEMFNALAANGKYPVRIDPAEGLFVETWVRTGEEIEKVLDRIKALVAAGNTAYDARMNAPVVGVVSKAGEVIKSPEQLRLDGMVARLNFD
ncbi:MAG: hypothetical protein ACFHX7_04785 [Pseudomonadota bacterium]